MGTNFHTAWINKPTPGFTEFEAASMNPALAALDKAITYLKNPMVGCEGVLSWDPDTGTLSWSAQLTIVFNRDNGDACHNHVAAGNVVLAAGQFAYVTLSETDNAAVAVSTGTVTTGSPSNFIADNILVLAYRSPTSGKLHFIWLDQPFVSAEGDVVGPEGATEGNLAGFGSATGKELADSGIALEDVDDAIAVMHLPGEDQYLDLGGPNEVSAEELKSVVDHYLQGESEPPMDNADLTLYPEYAGAVMTPSGSDNDPGTEGMTSDSEVVSNVRHNYYEWSSTLATGLQSYDIVIQIPIPFNFAGFQAGVSVALTLAIKTEENADTNNKLDVTINRDGQAATSALSGQYSASAATWETIGFDETDAILAAVVAGETLNVAIRMYSQNSKYVRIGKINLQIKVQ
jgi:hypothetical protein